MNSIEFSDPEEPANPEDPDHEEADEASDPEEVERGPSADEAIVEASGNEAGSEDGGDFSDCTTLVLGGNEGEAVDVGRNSDLESDKERVLYKH